MEFRFGYWEVVVKVVIIFVYVYCLYRGSLFWVIDLIGVNLVVFFLLSIFYKGVLCYKLIIVLFIVVRCVIIMYFIIWLKFVFGSEMVGNLKIKCIKWYF